MTVDEQDILAELQDDLYWTDSGWIKTPPNERGEFAVFPETAKSESEWEARSVAMHATQVAPVLPEARVEAG